MKPVPTCLTHNYNLHTQLVTDQYWSKLLDNLLHYHCGVTKNNNNNDTVILIYT